MNNESPEMNPGTHGPHLSMALLCERVLEEKDGVLSIIRVVDRITQAAVGPNVPETMPPVPVNLILVISLKSGAARGRGTITVGTEAPSGQLLGERIELPVVFEGEDRGQNIVAQMGFTADMEGLYWFDVLYDKRLLTRVPLRIVYQPQRIGGGLQPGAG